MHPCTYIYACIYTYMYKNNNQNNNATIKIMLVLLLVRSGEYVLSSILCTTYHMHCLWNDHSSLEHCTIACTGGKRNLPLVPDQSRSGITAILE